MPSHPERVRTASLPKGYQFPTPQHQHEMAAFDVVMNQGVCACGARYNAEEPRRCWFAPNWPAEMLAGVGPGDIRAVGAGQTGEMMTTNGWSADRDLGDER